MNKAYIYRVILFLLAIFFFQPPSSFSTPIDIFVSIPPLKWLGNQIGKDLTVIHVLVGKSRDPHIFEPTPRQIIALSQSSLFFTTGMVFEKKITDKLETLAIHPTHVDLSQHVYKILITDNQEHETLLHDSSDTLGSVFQHNDPHIWLSPINLKIMAMDMAEALSLKDPKHAANYQYNLQSLLGRLDQLNLNLERTLEPYRGATIFVFHPAFSYFTATYHLEQKAVEIEGKSPTPRELATIIAQAKKANAKVIFTQPQFDPRSATTIASAIQAAIIPLDPLAENVETNLTMMAETIIQALNP